MQIESPKVGQSVKDIFIQRCELVVIEVELAKVGQSVEDVFVQRCELISSQTQVGQT